MLNVSAKWHDASRQQFRYQAYLTVKLEVVPPGIRQGVNTSSDATFNQSSVDTITDGLSSSANKFISLEQNRFVLDGSFTALPDSVATSDWWSESAVDGSKPTVVFVFDKPYTIPGMTIVWDSENQTFPTKATVQGYDVNGNKVYDITITDIDSYSGFYDSVAMDDVKSVVLVVDEWSLPTWRARIDEVTFGYEALFDSVNNGRIQSATQTSKADPLNSKLPTRNMDVVLRNYDGYFDATLQHGVAKYLAQQQIMKVQWAFIVEKGVIERSPEQVYLMEQFNIPADSKEVTLNMTNRLAMLDSDFYYGTYTGSSRTLFEIAEYVLSKSGALLEYTGQKPWVIPESLANISTTAPIPSGATNTVLQLIALASCTWLTIRSTDGFIQFRESDSDVSQYCAVDKAQELGDPSITIKDRLRSVSIGVYSYTARATKETVGESKYTLSGTNTIRIKYNKDYATDVSASVSGATLVSGEYYSSYAILTLSASSSGAEVKVTLTGKVIDVNTSYFEVYRNASVADGKDIVIENPLITELSHATLVAEYVRDYYLKRGEYSVPYIGYPQAEPCDKISLTTVYGSDSVEIKNNTIDFNGGWSGTMEVI